MAKKTHSKHKLNRRRSHKWLWILCVFILLIGLVAALELTNKIHIFHKTTPVIKVNTTTSSTGSSTPTKTSTGSSTPTKTPTSNTNRIIGGGVDTNGQAPSSTNPSQWIVSQSGNITVKQPTTNSKIQNGSVLSGSAKTDEIDFRLIDNNVGVIAQGTLSVVNGNFSGTLQFQSNATGGRLDVFSTDSQGVEINEVQVSIGF